MKTLIATVILLASIGGANAEPVSEFYAKCCAVGTVKFRDLSKENPTYQSTSRTVIQSSYGTSVINSTYRSYRR